MLIRVDYILGTHGAEILLGVACNCLECAIDKADIMDRDNKYSC